MRRLVLLAVLLLPAFALAQNKTIVCPSMPYGTAYEACKIKTLCVTQPKDTDNVLTRVAGVMSYQQFSTIPLSGEMFQCGGPNKWTTREALGFLLTSGYREDVKLTWVPSTTNTDDSPITKPIDTFTVYKGTSESNLSLLTATKEQQFVDSQQPEGTYYYAVTQTVAGAESAKSQVVSKQVTKPAPPAAPTLNFSCTPKNGVESVTVQCSWTSTGADKCVASGSWSGDKAVSGNEALPVTNVDAAYTLTCTGVGGVATATENIVVMKKPRPPTVAIEQ